MTNILPKLREHRNRYKTHLIVVNFIYFDAKLNPH